VLDFQGHRFQEFLRAGQPVYTTDKLRLFWKLKLSIQTGFDVNRTSLLFPWKGSFRDMNFEAIPLPFETLRAASSDGETSLSKGLKASQVLYVRTTDKLSTQTMHKSSTSGS